jgi:hypothetical protein
MCQCYKNIVLYHVLFVPLQLLSESYPTSSTSCMSTFVPGISDLWTNRGNNLWCKLAIGREAKTDDWVKKYIKKHFLAT